MQSTPGAGRARTSLRSCTPGPTPGLGSVEALVKGRARERCAPRTLGRRGPRLPPFALHAESRRAGEAGRPGEGRPHGGREPPGSADAREPSQVPGAQGAGGREGSDGTGGGWRSPGGALTWARAARRGCGLLAGASILLLALPLASAFFALGHLAYEVHALRGRLRAKTTRDKFGPRV